MKKLVKSSLFLVAFLILLFFFVDYRATTINGLNDSLQVIEIGKGESFIDTGLKLQNAGVISWRGYFAYYVWKKDLRRDIIAGKYQLSGKMTVPEIVNILISGDTATKSVTITFPEGWDSRKMADRLNANNLPGDDFVKIVYDPVRFRESVDGDTRALVADIPEGASLEGFLFPDTYTFSSEISADSIVKKMLQNFQKHIISEDREALSVQGKTLFEAVTMASIVESEVRTEVDRKMVADLFWRRIETGMLLQSDATVQYVRGENKVKHSFEETRVKSPYNTYVNKGLPPGPIDNPGLESIRATIYPTPNDFVYFLNDTKTGETVFAKTFEEHVSNKSKHGL